MTFLQRRYVVISVFNRPKRNRGSIIYVTVETEFQQDAQLEVSTGGKYTSQKRRIHKDAGDVQKMIYRLESKLAKSRQIACFLFLEYNIWDL
jgi:hypothetical protein